MLLRFIGYRRALRCLIAVAALAFGGGQVLYDWHVHESTDPEEICGLCGFSDSALVRSNDGNAAGLQFAVVLQAAQPTPNPFVLRPFEKRLLRAPPVR